MGIITVKCDNITEKSISPCMLPMLPIYISYFAGQGNDEGEKNSKMIFKVIAFVLGFTIVFTLL